MPSQEEKTKIKIKEKDLESSLKDKYGWIEYLYLCRMDFTSVVLIR